MIRNRGRRTAMSFNDTSPPLAPQEMLEKNRADIACNLTIGRCYRIVPQKHKSSDKNWLDSYRLRYEGKEGIFHKFREQKCGWTTTLTDAQLRDKRVEEV